MAGEVLHADIETFLTGWYRPRIAARPEGYCEGVEVDRVEPLPGQTFPRRLVVIRDDSGPTDELVVGQRSVGVSVLAGSKEDPTDAMNLARMLVAMRTMIPAVELGNPVTAILETNGPYLVSEDQPHARAYFTMVLAVAGDPL